MHCNGCGNHYGSCGLQSHILQTTNPTCKEEFYMQNRQCLVDVSDDPSMDLMDIDDEPSQPFKGDFFGANYGSDNFDYHPDSNSTSSDSDFSGESDLNLDADYEHDWEPEIPRPLPPLQPEDTREESEAHTRCSQQSAAQQSIHCTPYIEHFNNTRSCQAGMPIQDSSDLSANEQYKSNFGASNIYAPFTSELDWRTVQWAKMHGPGSTAFSKLLSIPGVHASCIANIRNSLI